MHDTVGPGWGRGLRRVRTEPVTSLAYPAGTATWGLLDLLFALYSIIFVTRATGMSTVFISGSPPSRFC